jgi:NAD+ synthase (glutamine-hydrolysing)
MMNVSSEKDDLPKIALVQMDVKPGRPDLNLQKMLSFIQKAREQQAELVVFSELCVSGYILGDLWEVDTLIEDFAGYNEKICQASKGLTVLFGNIVLQTSEIGEDGRVRKYNAVLVCSDGEFVVRKGLPCDLPYGMHPKTLHPNYRFFDDDRHFYSLRKFADSQGCTVLDWLVPYKVKLHDGRDFSFGVQLCEDVWCQDYTSNHEVLDTLKTFHQKGAQAVFNLSSSPWTWQKNRKRNQVVRDILKKSPLPFFYVNQVGAQNNGKNIIVFDGDTTYYSAQGRRKVGAKPWTEQILFSNQVTDKLPDDSEIAYTYEAICTGLRHLDDITGRQNRFMLGVSGGIDSSVVACLLEQTFGNDRVFAVNMPTQFNSSITQNNAQALCNRLEVDYISCSIQDLYENLSDKIKNTGFQSEPGEYTRLVDENIQARIRGADVLAGLAAKCGLFFTNNGNKTEVALGYATLYGDVNGAVAPLADLYKPQVIALGRFLNERVYGFEVIPENLLTGDIVPSAELSAAQDVTKGLGDPIKYGYHDAVLRQMIEYRKHVVDFMKWYIDGNLLKKIDWKNKEQFDVYFSDAEQWLDDLLWLERQLRINYFKRIQAPPIIVLSKRAFGFDLRESQLSGYMPLIYKDLRAQVLCKGRL